MRIGVTGGIATGKNLVTNYFKELGCYIIDADEIYHELIYPGKPLWKKLVEEFGSTILHPQNMIDRKRLGDIVFNNKEALKKLNSITHNEIIKKIEERAKLHENDYK
ncbi:MAG TPA: dephospho-CoA kinase, partial [Candidatus Atribacteria bacterium]|nr:dephospho-CoA kinase [Candidatus Atribacteria bacterium]